MAEYRMTSDEELVYRSVSDSIKSIKKWGTWTTAATRRDDRMAVNRIKDEASAKLKDPKKSYIISTLKVLWDNWMNWSKLGQDKLQSRMLDGLKKIQVALTLAPEVVTIEKVVEVQATAPVLPVLPPAPIVPPGRKLFGMPMWAVVAGTGVIVIGGIYFVSRKKR